MCIGVFFKQLEDVDEARADQRITTQTDASALPMSKLGQLPDRLIGERAGAAHHTHMPRRVDIAWHDADLALARSDHTWAVGADEPAAARFHDGQHSGHVDDWNALGDCNHRLDACSNGLENRIGGERWRHEDHRGVGAGGVAGFSHRVEHRQTSDLFTTLAWSDAADHSCAVVEAATGVELTDLASDALADHASVAIDDDAHGSVSRKAGSREPAGWEEVLEREGRKH
jgi:hypothetical protein